MQDMRHASTTAARGNIGTMSAANTNGSNGLVITSTTTVESTQAGIMGNTIRMKTPLSTRHHTIRSTRVARVRIESQSKANSRLKLSVHQHSPE